MAEDEPGLSLSQGAHARMSKAVRWFEGMMGSEVEGYDYSGEENLETILPAFLRVTGTPATGDDTTYGVFPAVFVYLLGTGGTGAWTDATGGQCYARDPGGNTLVVSPGSGQGPIYSGRVYGFHGTGATGFTGGTGMTGGAALVIVNSNPASCTGGTSPTGSTCTTDCHQQMVFDTCDGVNVTRVTLDMFFGTPAKFCVSRSTAAATPAPAGPTGATGPSGTGSGPTGAAGAAGAAGATGPEGKGYKGTSLSIGTGSKSLTTQSNLAYNTGARARFSAAIDPINNYMEGVVSGYSGSTLSIIADYAVGGGSYDIWIINLAGDVGSTGTGMTGATGADGATGATGGIGATGPTGPIGATGAQGIQGIQGPTGATGSFPNGTSGTAMFANNLLVTIVNGGITSMTGGTASCTPVMVSPGTASVSIFIDPGSCTATGSVTFYPVIKYLRGQFELSDTACP